MVAQNKVRTFVLRTVNGKTFECSTKTEILFRVGHHNRCCVGSYPQAPMYNNVVRNSITVCPGSSDPPEKKY